MLLLIDELLNWTKSQEISINVNIDKIKVSNVIGYVKEQIEIIGHAKEIELELVNTFNHDYLLADKNMLDAILRNLISNAVKFSTKGSKIKLSLSEVKNCCQICIRDYGKGMSEKEINDFKKGVAFSTTGLANEKGHGLGLQLIKEFLHKQNSELQMESHQGFGSRFYFLLPIAE